MAAPNPSSDENGIRFERRAKVEAARERWIRSLIDKSRRNSLLYFRPLKAGTLELAAPDPKAMERFLKREEVSIARLLPKGADLRQVEGTLAEIRGRAVENSEERGLETLFIAMGMATWESPDGERPPEAPVLLIPLKVTPRLRGGAGFALTRTGDIQANLVLLHVLESEYRVRVEAEELLKALQGDDEGEIYDPQPVYELLRHAARELKGFSIQDRLIIGNFAFQKTAMVKDLRECAEQLVAHDLISAICGDVEAQRSVSQRRSVADPSELDRTDPDDEFLFLDADSSQQLVIRHALALQDGTIQGPPGTGKSQTIANLIAEFAARGKRVLFVAEKRAALNVVLDRLRHRGLEHLALDLHGAEISRRQVLDALHESRQLVRQAVPVDADKQHAKLINRRDRLQQHVGRMHSPCPPTGHSVFQVQGALLQLGEVDHTATRWTGEALAKLAPTAIDQAEDLLSEVEEFRELFLRISTSPWNGALLADQGAVREATSHASDLAGSWPDWLGKLLAMCFGAGLAQPQNPTSMREQFASIAELRHSFDEYRPELFTEGQLERLLAGLRPATRSLAGRFWSWVASREYREALRTARSYRLSPKVSAPILYEEIADALNRSQRWLGLTSERTPPRPVPAFLEIRRTFEQLEVGLKKLFMMLQRRDLETLRLDELSRLIEGLARDKETPARLPHVFGLERQLHELGLQPLVEEMRRRHTPAAEFKNTLQHAWLSSALEQARERDPSLLAFHGRTHDKVVQEFRMFDRDRIHITADRVRRAHAERAVAIMNDYPAEDVTVKTECQRKRSRMSVRKLLMEAPHVTTALRPCWMASPLSVSHLLPADRNLFDIVLFDEASQVFPHDAVPALLRAPRAIVAGDRHQLPPTAFFLADEAPEDETDEQDVTSGFESILDQMSGLFDPWTLDWHYRSLDEALIAFSNRHIYDDRLVTFPGPGLHRAIEHVLVDHQRLVDGQEDSVTEEARKVVELVLRHAADRPRESLGVIALGIKHQRRIEAALEEALKDCPDFDAFFDESQRERFFVKNLERVQGDERDAIILSVGYGKDRAGKLVYRFGPLGTEGGKRRMNVAVTRARKRMTVVSSFVPHDMDPARCKQGVEFLRLYLQYAMSGGANLGVEQPRDVPLNDFEQGVHDALIARGIKLLKQWGASRYRIDLVAQHPEEPGRHVLAIECDGATYHSAQSARDRDRLRQQHLEALGWRFHRIWSTDWFNNRVDELERTLKAYEEAVRAADASDNGEEGSPRPATRREPKTAAPRRTRKPSIPLRDSIDEYLSSELIGYVEWIMSDELLRTDDEILAEMIELLGFERRGARIVERITSAIRAYRAKEERPASTSDSAGSSDYTSRAMERLVERYHLDLEVFRQRRASSPKIPDRDLIRGLMNEDLQRLMMRSDLQGLATRYYEMALFAAEEDRSFVEFLALAHEKTLQHLERVPGVASVRINASIGCDDCRRQDGAILSIKEALRSKPLPCSACTMVVVGTKPGFCRCVYEAEV